MHWVAERYTAIRRFFDAHPGALLEPVRGIIASGRGYSAADLYETQTRLRALGQQAAGACKADSATATDFCHEKMARIYRAYPRFVRGSLLN